MSSGEGSKIKNKNEKDINDEKQHHCLCFSPQPRGAVLPPVSGAHSDVQAPAARAETQQLQPALSACSSRTTFKSCNKLFMLHCVFHPGEQFAAIHTPAYFSKPQADGLKSLRCHHRQRNECQMKSALGNMGPKLGHWDSDWRELPFTRTLYGNRGAGS